MAQGKQLEELFEALKNENIVKTKQDYCNLMNIDYKSFSRLLRDELNYQINPTNFEVLKKLDINIEWFITGQGSMFNSDQTEMIIGTRPTKHNNHFEYTKNDNVIYLNVYSGTVSAGHGEIAIDSEIIGQFPVIKEMIDSCLAEKSFIIKVKGDSMTPTLYNNDYVIGNTELNHTSGEGIYIIRMYDNFLVKRIQFNFDNTLTIISDNARYERQIIPIQNENIQIVAKVVGWVHKHLY
ncbi:MAG: hypothetical protein A2015_02170 [Spirochaetes bacterium GWF1_31_7]|nr:MAG: hypothetical protein A2Y30_06020 [Spirochaetes bacterium GWE1_32_154]OHD50721.1 MAG: hypothetical protein A2015_02170 [Spirochaetes bacterium GWF1_31_7]OHD73150.1 MAG: hypothetical protein A2355_05015 [Spirochaetes bacterium RIFOXYB1_FULL_32_8]HBD95057.1 hypothetical protein [Spirochaetia bacterium]HBI38057.1 hypothetical protein [Spirochaetia bacterium]